MNNPTKEELFKYGWDTAVMINNGDSGYEIDKSLYKAVVCQAIKNNAVETYQEVAELIDDIKFKPNIPMNNSFEDVLKQYEKNKENMEGYPFYFTEAEYNIIKQLIRFELKDLIANDANDKVIDHLIKLDASINAQYTNMVNSTIERDELPF
jgi:hypothetical protein